MICIATERLTVIRNPLQEHGICERSCAGFLIVIIFILSAIVQTSRFFGYEIIETKYENKTVFCYAYQLGHVMLRISRSVLPFITVVIPLVILTVLNVLLIYYIRLSRMNVKKLGYVNPSQQLANVRNERKVTQLVLAILITFFVFNVPSAVVALLTAVVHDQIWLVRLYGLPVQTTNHMVVFCKVINFFLYFCCSSKFRKKFLHYWQRFRKKSLWTSISTRTNSIILSLRRLSLTSS